MIEDMVDWDQEPEGQGPEGGEPTDEAEGQGPEGGEPTDEESLDEAIAPEEMEDNKEADGSAAEADTTLSVDSATSVDFEVSADPETVADPEAAVEIAPTQDAVAEDPMAAENTAAEDTTAEDAEDTQDSELAVEQVSESAETENPEPANAQESLEADAADHEPAPSQELALVAAEVQESASDGQDPNEDPNEDPGEDPDRDPNEDPNEDPDRDPNAYDAFDGMDEILPDYPLHVRLLDLLYRRNVRIALACVLALVVVIVAASAITVQSRKLQEAEREAAHQQALNEAVTVPVTVHVSNYDGAHTTPVPLHVSGATEAGDIVDDIRLVAPYDSNLSLVPGTYAVSPAGSPVTDQGYIYYSSVDSFAIIVDANGSITINGKPIDAADSIPAVFVYELIAPEDVKDADISAARAWMEKAGIQDAGAYADAVLRLRNETVERIAAEQKAKEDEALRATSDETHKAEESLRKRSGATNDYYSYELPTSWVGKVDTRTNTNAGSDAPETIIYLKGNRNAWLARITYKDLTGSDDGYGNGYDENDYGSAYDEYGYGEYGYDGYGDDEYDADDYLYDEYGNIIGVKSKSSAKSSTSSTSSTSTQSSNDENVRVVVTKPSSDWTHQVEVSILNWPLIAAMGTQSSYAEVTDEELEQLVSLSTDNKVSLTDLYTSYDYSMYEAAPNFATEAFSTVAAQK